MEGLWHDHVPHGGVLSISLSFSGGSKIPAGLIPAGLPPLSLEANTRLHVEEKGAT